MTALTQNNMVIGVTIASGGTGYNTSPTTTIASPPSWITTIMEQAKDAGFDTSEQPQSQPDEIMKQALAESFAEKDGGKAEDYTEDAAALEAYYREQPATVEVYDPPIYGGTTTTGVSYGGGITATGSSGSTYSISQLQALAQTQFNQLQQSQYMSPYQGAQIMPLAPAQTPIADKLENKSALEKLWGALCGKK